MTIEPGLSFGAEPGQARLRAKRAPNSYGDQAVHSGRHRRVPEERSSYREIFAIGEIRAIWTAQVLSYAGDQFTQVAIAIVVYGRTHSPFLTALAYALTYLPRSPTASCSPDSRTCSRGVAT